MAEDFTGRVWETTVTPAGDMRRHEQEERERSKGSERQERHRLDDNAVMEALDELDPYGSGHGIRRVRAKADLTHDRMMAAVVRLVTENIIREIQWTAPIGSGADREAAGIVRVK